ncbi:AAA family ATPase [Flavobacterium algicola]|uniref:AAA family ATPase n=1 Tax=Flavobacterium algicola TaxID=556529 RepID=UPI001EFD330E|nr:AAA family ATPase [Flavobacterium algicola]MCG9793819.1 AAA family ATPase [Flavobacterium algicola]
MKITNIILEGVGGIKNLTLNFNPNMNIICGPNGIGKTTILESIAHLFSNGQSSILKRSVNSEYCKIKALVEKNGEILHATLEFDTFIPEKLTQMYGLHDFASEIISLKTSRTFQYQLLSSVNRDSNKDDYTCWMEAINGINILDIKNWFVHRYLYSVHKNALSQEQINNYELAKQCFSYLNTDFTFSRVDASSNDIMINTPSGEIYYEYLSSGFKSIISILFGIIKEIEFRFKEPRVNAKDFEGIIVIDEIELHLHPEWQEKVVNILMKAFPKAQFFLSTHSPHVIQNSLPKQIIALGIENGEVFQRELPESEYGFQGWTVEEVLTDIMGMTDLRTSTFNKLIENFESEIELENYKNANEIYTKIDELLHPQNQLRKLLKFQLISIE